MNISNISSFEYMAKIWTETITLTETLPWIKLPVSIWNYPGFHVNSVTVVVPSYPNSVTVEVSS